MKIKPIVAALILCLALSLSAGEVKITLFQLNDVSEMIPVNGGKKGGLARVKTLMEKLEKENPNTYSILAGDLFSPSAIGIAKVNGTPLAGEHMVDVLNKMEWDFFTFGNHEFDLKKPAFEQRLKEAKFRIFTANVFDAATGKPFNHTEKNILWKVEGVTVGLVGVTLAGLKADYVKITDPLEVAKAEVARLRKEQNADIVIVVAHIPLVRDIQLAEEIPGAVLVLGGHEHENIQILRGPDYNPITQTDANAKSAFIHRLTFDTQTKKLTVATELQLITPAIKENETIKKVVRKWKDLAFESFRQENIDPDQFICKLPENFDGQDSSVRNKSTRLTRLIADAYFHAFDRVDLSIFNGGSIRIDDVLPEGQAVTMYDILRIMPFGGTLCKVTMPGRTLRKALEAGLSNRGSGGFLHYANAAQQNGTWEVAGNALDDNKIYTAAIATFLVERGDTNLEFLKTGGPSEVKRLPDTPAGVRDAIIAEFKRVYGKTKQKPTK